MKTSTPQLRALLASRQFHSADIFLFSLVDGTQLRYTTADSDIVVGADVYSCGGFSGAAFDRFGDSGSGCSWKRGLEVDTLTFNVLPRGELINGVPFLSACRRGAFDGAELTLSRAYMPVFGDTSAGTVILFSGRVAEIDAGRTQAGFQIASHLELLNQQMPRDLYMPGCINSLYDASCGLLRDNFVRSGTVAAGSTNSVIMSAVAGSTGYFDLGVVTFATGVNAGASRTIKAFLSGGTIKLMSPLSDAPAVGDQFSIYPGCDKTAATCKAKYNNRNRFRGFPTVPQPETAT